MIQDTEKLTYPLLSAFWKMLRNSDCKFDPFQRANNLRANTHLSKIFKPELFLLNFFVKVYEKYSPIWTCLHMIKNGEEQWGVAQLHSFCKTKRASASHSCMYTIAQHCTALHSFSLEQKELLHCTECTVHSCICICICICTVYLCLYLQKELLHCSPSN